MLLSREEKVRGRAMFSFAARAMCMAMALLVSGCGILRCGGTSLYGVAINICANG
jgi:hypothetical protein